MRRSLLQIADKMKYISMAGSFHQNACYASRGLDLVMIGQDVKILEGLINTLDGK